MTAPTLSPDDFMALSAAGPEPFRALGLDDGLASIFGEYVALKVDAALRQDEEARAISDALAPVIWNSLQFDLGIVFVVARWVLGAANGSRRTVH